MRVLANLNSTGRFGSVAVIEYIPKAAVWTAAIGAIADLAIRRKRQVASGKYWPKRRAPPFN